ncbi:cell surface glycoprotein MUC18-like isoform X3 [Arapaima gigas]
MLGGRSRRFWIQRTQSGSPPQPSLLLLLTSVVVCPGPSRTDMASPRSASLLAALQLLVLTWQVPARALVTVTMSDTMEVFIGNTVEIPCHYSFSEEPSMVMIQWFVSEGNGGNRERIFYSDKSMRIADNGTDFTTRISLSGGLGNLVLSVQDVRLSDEREFICQVNGMSAGNAESKTQLKVFDPPEAPVIEGSHYGISVTADGPSMIASCEVREGYPRPNVTWYRDNTLLLPKPDLVNVVTLVTRESNGLYSIQSNLRYKVSKVDKDVHFHCRTTYSIPGAVKTADSKPINITVYYPTTVVEIWKESPKGLVKEGDTVVIRCRGDGNPPPIFSFIRKGEQEEELDSRQDLLTLTDVNRGDSGVFQCRSLDLDTYEEVTGDMQLDVHYLDPVKVVPKESEVLSKGESMIATCSAMSSLETSTVWLKNGRQVGEGPKLLLKDATFDTAGEYVCDVTVPSLPGIRTAGSVHIIVQGAPELNNLESLTDMEESMETSVNLTCEAQGFPKPTITWNVLGTQNWHEVLNRVTANRAVSIVTVKVLADITASCNATNQMGADWKSFRIKAIPLVTSTAANTAEGSGVIIVVIIVCILLLAILGSVLYFLYKKGKIPCGRSGKQDITKEKTSKGDIVVEMKSEKTEEAVLLKGVNGEKRPSNEQGGKYVDVQN